MLKKLMFNAIQVRKSALSAASQPARTLTLRSFTRRLDQVRNSLSAAPLIRLTAERFLFEVTAAVATAMLLAFLLSKTSNINGSHDVVLKGFGLRADTVCFFVLQLDSLISSAESTP